MQGIVPSSIIGCILFVGNIRAAPDDPAMLQAGIMRAVQLVGRRFADPRDWAETVKAIDVAGGLIRQPER